jgi:hypothetical protein
MFKVMFASTVFASLLLTGCPDRERVRVVEERKPDVVIEHRDGHVEEHREEIHR